MSSRKEEGGTAVLEEIQSAVVALELEGRPLVTEAQIRLGDLEVWCERGNLRALMQKLKTESPFSFNMFISVTVIDWVDSARERFEAVYHLLSIAKNTRIRVRAWVPEEDAVIDSVADLWPGADFMEREAWDMFGVVFRGHPNLRRILMYDEFQGYPLRKDYPVHGKQPRIPLRAPEVRNTAVDMKRAELVAINPKRRQ
jgi:NADH-quinone oxidoreductase subunit C